MPNIVCPMMNYCYDPRFIPTAQYPIYRNYSMEEDYMENMAHSKMMISARNQLKGKVTDIKEGSVNAQVSVDIGCGDIITSIITISSLKDLGIEECSKVTVIIKSSNVMLAVDESDSKRMKAKRLMISARNQIGGTVTEIKEGSVNAQVTIDIGCGKVITSIITISSIKDLGIKIGSKVIAIMKSSDVMLAV